MVGGQKRTGPRWPRRFSRRRLPDTSSRTTGKIISPEQALARAGLLPTDNAELAEVERLRIKGLPVRSQMGDGPQFVRAGTCGFRLVQQCVLMIETVDIMTPGTRRWPHVCSTMYLLAIKKWPPALVF